MPEAQDVFRLYGAEYEAAHRMSAQQRKAFEAIAACRTSKLGGHRDACPECGEVSISYNSCRNRHCPKCQAYRKEKWVEERSADLLDVGYYHAVFTVPAELKRPLLLQPGGDVRAAVQMRMGHGRRVPARSEVPRSQDGATAVPHTWGRRMQYHPHVHMIIPSGGLTREGSWRRGSSKFFAPVKAMSKVFRGKLLSAIQKMRPALSFCGEAAHLADDGAFSSLISALYSKDWVVYCKKPFAGVGHALHYLGRYTHRVAISNNRIASINDGRVAFDYRDAHDGDRVKRMTLAADEFIRRFLMHVLPKGFSKMRHYGILASRGKNERIDRCKRLANTPVTARMAVDAERIVERMIGRKPGTCAHCGCRTVAPPLMC